MAHPRGRARLLAVAMLTLTIAATAAPTLALAAARKLNGPLAPGGSVAPLERHDAALGRSLRPGYQLTPDGARAVFLAEGRAPGALELFSAPLSGGAPVRLSGDLAPGGSVLEFAVDSLGQRVVYLADQRTDDTFELFSVPTGGGAPVALNSLLATGGDVSGFVLSPDGSTAVFRADRSDDEVYDLFSAPIDGGAPDVRLNGRTTAFGDVQPDFAISPDSQRVVFRYDPLESGTFGLFSAPLTGSAADDLGGGAGQPGGRSALDFAISPNSQRVAFRGRDPGGAINLFLTTISGPVFFFFPLTSLPPGSAVEAPPESEVPAADRLPEEPPYAFAPDGADIIFIADATDTIYQLFSITTSVGPGPAPAPTLLSPFIDDAVEDVTNFRISPLGDRVVYRADDVDDAFELIAVLRDGTSPTFLLQSPSGSADVREFAITPDGRRVIYRGDLGADEVFELYSSPVDRSAGTTQLSGPLAPEGDVLGFTVAPSGQRVVYTADQEIDGVVGLYSVLATGGTPARLNLAPAGDGDVTDFTFSPSGARVVFRAGTAADERFMLVSVAVAGPASAGVILSDTGTIGGDVVAHELSADGAYDVYLADQERDEVFELYRVALDGGAPVRLSGELGLGGDVTAFRVGRTGGHVVYIADQEADEVFELYSAPIAGGPAVKLSPPLPERGDVADVQVSPDGTRAVYVADQERNGDLDLYSVPATGGTAVPLSDLLPGGSLRAFAISPNGQRVVYIAEQAEPGAFELYSVPIGGGSPVTLSGPLPAGGGIASFQISPDSQRVVYLGDQHTDEVFELYSVPLADGAVARVSQPLAAERDVGGCAGQRGQWDPLDAGEAQPFQISPDSRRVVYCADQDTDDLFELYSAPIAAGTEPVKLSFPPGAGGYVSGFEISQDSSRAVFQSIASVAGSLQGQLYSAPLDGGSPPTLLNGPTRALNFISSFAISHDSTTVIFTSDRALAGQEELYSVAIGGGAPSRRSADLPPDGDVRSFQISKDGARLVYLAGPPGGRQDELFHVAVAGEGEATSVSGPLTRNGGVRPDYRLRPASDTVVYRADQASDEVVELFAARLPGPDTVLFLPLLRR